jgi:hypothetical protein
MKKYNILLGGEHFLVEDMTDESTPAARPRCSL